MQLLTYLNKYKYQTIHNKPSCYHTTQARTQVRSHASSHVRTHTHQLT